MSETDGKKEQDKLRITVEPVLSGHPRGMNAGCNEQNEYTSNTIKTTFRITFHNLVYSLCIKAHTKSLSWLRSCSDKMA